MGALEEINQLRGQGMPDEIIIRRLKEDGFSPRDINDGFNQAQIKKAISDEPQPPVNEEAQQAYAPQEGSETQGDVYYPQPQADYTPQYAGQGGQEEYYSGGGFDTSTIIEISEQVFSEKIQKIQNGIDELSEFKKISESRLEHLNERLRKIEMMIDNLQLSILQKVGSYGGNLDNIKKEMGMMQDSFRKMVAPVAERYAERKYKPKDDLEMPIQSRDLDMKPKSKKVSRKR